MEFIAFIVTVLVGFVAESLLGNWSEILLQFSEVYRKSQMVFYSSVRSFPVHLHEHLQNMLLTDSFLYLQL